MVQIIYWAVGTAMSLLLGALAYSSIRERHGRAIGMSLALLLIFTALWFAGPLAFGSPAPLLWTAIAGAFLGALLFFLPLGSGPTLRTRASASRVDERDVMFAREEYMPGTEKHAQYYARHPERRARDDRIRALPQLVEPGGRLYEPEQARTVSTAFDELRTYVNEVDGPIAAERRNLTAEAAAAEIKALTLELGAGDVGIARLDPAYVYSHVGRGPEPWGAPIENDHAWAICMASEMAYPAVAAAPALAITAESAKQYLHLGKVSIALAARIRSWGYPARAHIAGSNYQVMPVALAHEAGLGELGRCGYLISRCYGARTRLGVVTTDLPLVADSPVALGVQDFCRRCVKCAVNCPSRAIPRGEKTWVRGAEKWPLKTENCNTYWRWLGTDCGLCMKVCPYAHPDGLIHDLIRGAIRRSPIARALAVWGDDLIYGRTVVYERLKDQSFLD